MTDTPARAGEQATEEQEGAAPAGAPAPERAADPTALVQEAAELKDRLLRALAEMENLRRRTEREVADARAYGISAFARDLLAIADNMRRALDAFGAEPHEAPDAGTKALLEGIELTERGAARLYDRGTGAAPGAGRRRQTRAESLGSGSGRRRARRGLGQRQFRSGRISGLRVSVRLRACPGGQHGRLGAVAAGVGEYLDRPDR